MSHDKQRILLHLRSIHSVQLMDRALIAREQNQLVKIFNIVLRCS